MDLQKHSAAVTTIAPMLSVRKGARAIEFYKAAFNAVEAFRIDAEDGAVVARLSVNGAEFWLADESPEHSNFSPETLGGGTVRMVLTVENPDLTFDRAISAGANRSGPFTKNMAGDLAGSWTLTVTIGKLANRYRFERSRRTQVRDHGS